MLNTLMQLSEFALQFYMETYSVRSIKGKEKYRVLSKYQEA